MNTHLIDLEKFAGFMPAGKHKTRVRMAEILMIFYDHYRTDFFDDDIRDTKQLSLIFEISESCIKVDYRHLENHGLIEREYLGERHHSQRKHYRVTEIAETIMNHCINQIKQHNYAA